MNGGLEIQWMVAEVERHLKHAEANRVARSRAYRPLPRNDRPSRLGAFVASARRVVRMPCVATRPARASAMRGEVGGS